jgi:protein-tyrosine phosphatase
VIDTHCHLLHDLDDGPLALEDAIVLAGQLLDAGIRYVVCTPHYSRRFPTRVDTARERLSELTDALSARAIPLELALAAELAPAAAVEAPEHELVARSFGRGYLLVELQPDTPGGYLEVLLDRLSAIGLIAVLAHPERCRAARSQPRLLDAARERGALVQVVAPSVVGRWGSETAAAGWRLLESGRADLLASDAHRPRRRGSHVAAALELVGRRLGVDDARRLTELVPAELTRRGDSEQ